MQSGQAVVPQAVTFAYAPGLDEQVTSAATMYNQVRYPATSPERRALK